LRAGDNLVELSSRSRIWTKEEAMDPIENSKASAPKVETVNESELDSNSVKEKTDHDSQIANRELEKAIEKLQLEQYPHHVQEAHIEPDAVSTTNAGSEWDPWKVMVLRRA
jgi:hypothetical protein